MDVNIDLLKREIKRFMEDEGHFKLLYDHVLSCSKKGEHGPVSLKTVYRIRKVDWEDSNQLKRIKCSTFDKVLDYFGYRELTPIIYGAIQLKVKDVMNNDNEYATWEHQMLCSKIGIHRSHLYLFMAGFLGNAGAGISRGLNLEKTLGIASLFEMDKILVKRGDFVEMGEVGEGKNKKPLFI